MHLAKYGGISVEVRTLRNLQETSGQVQEENSPWKAAARQTKEKTWRAAHRGSTLTSRSGQKAVCLHQGFVREHRYLTSGRFPSFVPNRREIPSTQHKLAQKYLSKERDKTQGHHTFHSNIYSCFGLCAGEAAHSRTNERKTSDFILQQQSLHPEDCLTIHVCADIPVVEVNTIAILTEVSVARSTKRGSTHMLTSNQEYNGAQSDTWEHYLRSFQQYLFWGAIEQD